MTGEAKHSFGQTMNRCKYRLIVAMAPSLTRPSCRPARSLDMARTCSVMAYETFFSPVWSSAGISMWCSRPRYRVVSGTAMKRPGTAA